jgi:hypothetical protein
VADITGFGLDVGDLVDFPGLAGKFYLTGFVVDADIFDLFLLAYVFYDLIDIVPGIEHHGIMSAKSDGIGQSPRPFYDLFHDLFLLVIDIEIGPGRQAEQQNGSDGQNQLRYKTEANVLDISQHAFTVFERGINCLKNTSKYFAGQLNAETFAQWLCCVTKKPCLMPYSMLSVGPLNGVARTTIKPIITLDWHIDVRPDHGRLQSRIWNDRLPGSLALRKRSRGGKPGYGTTEQGYHHLFNDLTGCNFAGGTGSGRPKRFARQSGG